MENTTTKGTDSPPSLEESVSRHMANMKVTLNNHLKGFVEAKLDDLKTSDGSTTPSKKVAKF